MKKLSPSKIKTLDTCTLKFGYNYHYSGPKLPNLQNSGSFTGTIAHDICELLLRNKKKYFKLVAKANKTNKLPRSLERLIKRKLKKEPDFNKEVFLENVINFVKVALNYDFWIEGSDLKEPEYQFDIQEDGYWIGGKIDAHGIFTDEKGSYAVIRDEKSQKQLFNNEELNNNLQGFTYLLAVKHKYPEIDIFRSRVEFVMLRHPETPVQVFTIKNERQMEGFISYLKYIQKTIDGFGPNNFNDKIAARLPYPKKDEGFKGPLVCGRGVTKFKEIKKDGSDLKYHCAYRFPFSYYSLIDEKGKVCETSFTPIKEREGFTCKKEEFAGCSAFQKREYKQPEFDNRVLEDVVDDFDF